MHNDYRGGRGEKPPASPLMMGGVYFGKTYKADS